MTEQFNDVFRRKLRAQAERLWRDRAATASLIEKALSKLSSNRPVLETIHTDFLGLLRMIKAAASGRYDRVPWTSILTALGAILYFLNPLDIIPDFIIGAGLIDDVSVIAMAISALRNDLSAFRIWEATNQEAAPSMTSDL